jgi:VanZ family protein
MNLIPIARALSWPLFAIAVFLTLAPPAFRPTTGLQRQLEHLLAFCLLGLLFGTGYPRNRFMMACLGVLVTALLEALQLLVPGRHAYFSDFVTNAVGTSFGFLVSASLEWARGVTQRAK